VAVIAQVASVGRGKGRFCGGFWAGWCASILFTINRLARFHSPAWGRLEALGGRRERNPKASSLQPAPPIQVAEDLFHNVRIIHKGDHSQIRKG